MIPGGEPVGPRRISLRRVLGGAFTLPARHLDDVLGQLGVPLLVVVGVALLGGAVRSSGSSGEWLAAGLYLLATSWLAIATHRMVLLDSAGSPWAFDGAAVRRLALFAVVGTGLWVVFHSTRLVLISLILTAVGSRYASAGGERPPSFVDEEAFLGLLDLGISALLFLVIGRLALLLPAIALGRRVDLPGTWRAAAGNSWRLAVIVGALPWGLKWLLSKLFGGGAAEWAVFQVALALILMIQVVALSLAYRELVEVTAPAPPPTDPRD